MRRGQCCDGCGNLGIWNEMGRGVRILWPVGRSAESAGRRGRRFGYAHASNVDMMAEIYLQKWPCDFNALVEVLFRGHWATSLFTL